MPNSNSNQIKNYLHHQGHKFVNTLRPNTGSKQHKTADLIIDPCDSPTWILGVQHLSKQDMLLDLESRLWFSYRSNFSAIKAVAPGSSSGTTTSGRSSPSLHDTVYFSSNSSSGVAQQRSEPSSPVAGEKSSSQSTFSTWTKALKQVISTIEHHSITTSFEYTSDQGWGCMMRTGQMMLAAAMQTRFLGREWRLPLLSVPAMLAPLSATTTSTKDKKSPSYKKAARKIRKFFGFRSSTSSGGGSGGGGSSSSQASARRRRSASSSRQHRSPSNSSLSGLELQDQPASVYAAFDNIETVAPGGSDVFYYSQRPEGRPSLPLQTASAAAAGAASSASAASSSLTPRSRATSASSPRSAVSPDTAEEYDCVDEEEYEDVDEGEESGEEEEEEGSQEAEEEDEEETDEEEADEADGGNAAAAGKRRTQTAAAASAHTPVDPDQPHVLHTDDGDQLVVANAKAVSLPPNYHMILGMFLDRPECPFSIHQIAQHGLLLGKRIGEWFGPTTICQVLKMILDKQFSDTWATYVADQGAIYIEEIVRLCLSGGGTRSEEKWKPLLLLIPLRLGLDKINVCYKDALKNVLKMPQTLGIVGGKPNSSLYFIGFQDDDDHLLYLDPHTVQKSSGLFETYHCSKILRIRIEDIDPSLALGFYCGSREEFEDMLIRMVDTLCSLQNPIITIQQERQQTMSQASLDRLVENMTIVEEEEEAAHANERDYWSGDDDDDQDSEDSDGIVIL